MLAVVGAAGMAFAAPALGQMSPSSSNGAPGGTGPTLNSGKGEVSISASVGRVASVDSEGRTVAIEGASRDLKIGPRTMVVKNGLNSDLQSVKPGDDVRAVFLDGEPIHPYQLQVTSPDYQGGSSSTASGTGSGSASQTAESQGDLYDGIGPPKG
jgi:hypothetical protein